jgi:hypothetical protein
LTKFPDRGKILLWLGNFHIKKGKMMATILEEYQKYFRTETYKHVQSIMEDALMGNYEMEVNYAGLPRTSLYTYEIKKPYVEDYVPKQVIFNDRTTIVVWKDNSKTIVRCADGEKFSEEIGLAEAIVKKLYGGNRSKFLRLVEGAYRQPEPKKK